MKNKYINFDRSPFHVQEKYIITYEDAFYDTLRQFRPSNVNHYFSYNFVLPGLFGLQPKEFFRYVISTYNAKTERVLNGRNNHIIFDTMADARKFCAEADRRFKLFTEEVRAHGQEVYPK